MVSGTPQYSRISFTIKKPHLSIYNDPSGLFSEDFHSLIRYVIAGRAKDRSTGELQLRCYLELKKKMRGGKLQGFLTDSVTFTVPAGSPMDEADFCRRQDYRPYEHGKMVNRAPGAAAAAAAADGESYPSQSSSDKIQFLALAIRSTGKSLVDTARLMEGDMSLRGDYVPKYFRKRYSSWEELTLGSEHISVLKKLGKIKLLCSHEV